MSIEIRWQHRVWSALSQGPWTLALLVANLTLLAFWPPHFRTWLYKALLTSKFVALSEDRTPGRISPGLRLWDQVNAYSIAIAAVSVPILIFFAFWWLLDLPQLWSAAEPASVERASVLQVVSASLVGGVAIDVFLITQLPQLLRPRVHVCFLRRNPNRFHIEGYYKDCIIEEELQSREKACLHFRVANIGTSTLQKLAVRAVFPSGFSFPGDDVPGTPLPERDTFRSWQLGGRVYFSIRDHPLDTSPGAAAVYHLIVMPPDVQVETRYLVHLRVATERTNGFTETKLRLKVQPAAS